MQRKCEEATSNLIQLVRIKSNQFSPERSSPSKQIPKRASSPNEAATASLPASEDLHPLMLHHPSQQQKEPEKQSYLQDFEDDFVAKLSPIKTSRYFNLKQELLNKRFFSPRSKNLIEIQ